MNKPLQKKKLVFWEEIFREAEIRLKETEFRKQDRVAHIRPQQKVDTVGWKGQRQAGISVLAHTLSIVPHLTIQKCSFRDGQKFIKIYF